MEETEIGGQHPRASLAPMPEPGQAHPPVSGLAMDGWEDCSSPSCSPKKSCCISLSASRCLSIPAYSSPRGRESVRPVAIKAPHQKHRLAADILDAPHGHFNAGF